MAQKKSANGMGSWYYDEKRKLHIFRITTGLDEKSKPRIKPFSGRTQEIANAKYEAWKAKGAFASIDPDIKLSDWADSWFEKYKEKIEESTAMSYQFTLNKIKEHLGAKRVKDIKAVDIETFLENMAEEYSASMGGKLRAMLGQMLRKAEANELISKNPVPLADKTNYRRMGKKFSKKKDAFTATEAKALMQGLPNTRIGHSIRLMLGTGISTQELLGLSTFDIGKDGATVTIRRAVKIKKGGGMYIGDVKAELRERIMEVPPAVQASAKFLHDNSDGYIIKGKSESMPMHPSTYRDFYKAAIKQIPGVRILTPHCCRHTFISHLEDAKVDFAVIQELSGQSEKSSTLKYIHAQSPAKAAAMSIINDLLTVKEEEMKES